MIADAISPPQSRGSLTETSTLFPFEPYYEVRQLIKGSRLLDLSGSLGFQDRRGGKIKRRKEKRGGGNSCPVTLMLDGHEWQRRNEHVTSNLCFHPSFSPTRVRADVCHRDQSCLLLRTLDPSLQDGA